MHCKEKKIARSIVLAPWVSETSIEVLQGQLYGSAGEKRGSHASTRGGTEKGDGSKEVELSYWGTCADVSVLQFKECEREQDEMVAGESSSLLSGDVLFRGSLQVRVLSR